MRWLRCCFCSLLCACILFGLSSVGAYALDDDHSYLNGDPVELYVLQDGVMTLADLTGYTVSTYFQGRGSTQNITFKDTINLPSVYREGYIVIQINLPSTSYLPKNSTFDLSLKYDMSPVSNASAKSVLYGPNFVSAGDAPSVEIDSTTKTIQIIEGFNNKAKLSVIEIWLTLSGMEWQDATPTIGTFHIGSTPFDYESGMTWAEWGDSSYNTLDSYGISWYDDNSYPELQFLEDDSVFFSYIYNSDVFSDSNRVKSTDLIQNKFYYLDDGVIPLNTYGYDFTFSIKSISISTMDDQELQGGILSWIKNIFNSIKNLPQNIADKIKGFFNMLGDKITDLGNALLDGIKGLFIPSEESLTEIKEEFVQLLADRFGAVYESAEVIDNFANAFFNQAQISTLSENSGTIHFPVVTVPLAGSDFSFGGWDIDVVPDRFESIIDILKVIIDIVCTFAFVNGLRKKLEVILK